MQTESLKLKYEVQQVISRKQFTEVLLARSLKQNKKVIIKRIIFKKFGQNSEIVKDIVKKEIEALKTIQNLNVSSYFDDFQDENSLYFVEEYFNSNVFISLGQKTLEQLLKKKVRLQEQEAIGIMKQILNGLQGKHKSHVMFRDLRFCKIIIQNHAEVKLLCLSMSSLLNRIEQINDYFDIIAPEVVEYLEYGLQGDVFSVGCIFYCLLYGKLPFATNSKDEYLQATKLGIKISLKLGQLDLQSVEISQVCKELLQKMLKSDPMERITFYAIYNHQFFKNIAWSNIGISSFLIQASSIDVNNILKFYQQNSLEIDQQIKSHSEQLINIKNISQNQEYPQVPMTEYKEVMQEIVEEQMNNDVQQNGKLDQIYKHLNRIFYYANTIVEFNQLNKYDPVGLSIYLSLKVQMEFLLIFEFLILNNDQNEYSQLISILEHLIEIAEYQVSEFKKQLKQSMLDKINKIFSAQDLNEQIWELGITYLFNIKNKPLRVHKHLLECIRNREIDKATFEPNLQYEFEIVGLKNEVKIKNELVDLLNQYQKQ